MTAFVDTDVCLDLLSGRAPHNAVAERLFDLAAKKKLRLAVSALTFVNLDYILKSQYSIRNGRELLSQLKTLVHVLPVSDKTIHLSLASKFRDFEDAVQHFTAIEAGIKVLISRNIRDYKPALIPVMNPENFLATL